MDGSCRGGVQRQRKRRRCLAVARASGIAFWRPHPSMMTTTTMDTTPSSSSSKGKEKAVGRDDGQLGPRLESLPTEILELIAFYCADNSTANASTSESVLSATPPFALRNLLIACQRTYSALSPSHNHRLYARIFRSKFDVAAIARRFGSSAVNGVNLTHELRRRCIILKRVKRAVGMARLFPDGTSDQSRTELEENLWLAFMMMMENDGLNILQLEWAQIRDYLYLHHSQDMLEAAYKPEYPRNTVDRALALHLNYLLTTPATNLAESQDESDERLFVLRPFVFAAHRFDPFFAPWVAKQLPIHEDQAKTEPESMDQNPFFASRRFRNENYIISHCGQEISICSPNSTQAACSSFFLKVEGDPAVTALNPFTNMMDLQQTMLGRGRRDWDEADEESPSYKPSSFTSKDHDRDMKRLMSCQMPYKSLGLKTFHHLGQFEGSWEGRFAYFAFESYRDMLGGKLRSLYEGQFGEQPQVWKIKEHIIQLKSDEAPGGEGDVLNSGYRDLNDEPTDREAMSLQQTRTLLREQRKARNDNYDLPDDIDHYPTFNDEHYTIEEMEDGDRYEILLSGTGHSAWGRFVLRGRIRSWDGMLIMTKEYRPDGRGRWLYRGYVVAGNRMVGRWRDTFTPEDMSGYEGCFLLHRRED